MDAARLPAEGITPSRLSMPSGVAVRLPQPMRSVAAGPDGSHLRGPDRGQRQRRTVRGWKGSVTVASRSSATSSLKWLAVLIPLADRLLQCLPPSTDGFRWIVIRRGEHVHLSLRHGSAAITAKGHHLENVPPTIGAWNPGFLLNVPFFYQKLRGDPSRKIEVGRFRWPTFLGWLRLAILGHHMIAVFAFMTQYALYRATPGADLRPFSRAGGCDQARRQVRDREPPVGFTYCCHRRLVPERICGDKAGLFG